MMSRSVNGEEPVLQEFIDILYSDNASDDEDLNDVGDGSPRSDPIRLNRRCNLSPPLMQHHEDDKWGDEDVPMYVMGLDGNLVPLECLLEEEPGRDSNSDDEDPEVERARQQVYDRMSPISINGEPTMDCSTTVNHSSINATTTSPENPARFRIEVEGARIELAVRGGASRRGRGRGRVGGARRAWTRGQPYIEMYISDDDLPEELQAHIRRLIAGRSQRAAPRHVEEQDDDEDGIDEFFDGQDFVWTPMENWAGQKETFRVKNPGPSQMFENAYDSFRAIWDDEILSHIVEETNRYAQNIDSVSFRQRWLPTTVDEILKLFTFWMMLGIIKMPSIKSCFSKMPILRTEIFRYLFSEHRYWDLNRAFHLSSGTSTPPNATDPMGPILDHLNKKFKRLYTPSQNICVDESLTLWKGPLSFKQYIKSKSARFGIKTYQLCESATGYLWSFFIYVGRGTNTPSQTNSIATVLRLVRPLLNLGHVLYMDNYFNSPLLARYLKRNGTDCVGTLNPNRKHVPQVIQRCHLAEGQLVARHAGDVMVVAVHDRKKVTCLSTFHDLSQMQTEAKTWRPSQHKLNLINDYNKAMGGVDRLDQMLEPYLLERKQCMKWTKKMFKRLLNISIQNSRILLEKARNSKIDSLAHRLTLVQLLMNHHVPVNKTNAPTSAAKQRTSNFPLSRLRERHFIRRITITDEMRQNIKHKTNLGRRMCAWCTKHGRTSKTVYECPKCNVALCLDRLCFEEFHTVP